MQTKLPGPGRKLFFRTSPVRTSTTSATGPVHSAVIRSHSWRSSVPVGLHVCAGNLRKMLKQIVESSSSEERDRHFDALTEIVTLVQFANDECDYGEGLELGLDLFCYGSAELHSTVLSLLPLAYQLLGRHQFANIITAHLANRTNSVLSLNQLAFVGKTVQEAAVSPWR